MSVVFKNFTRASIPLVVYSSACTESRCFKSSRNTFLCLSYLRQCSSTCSVFCVMPPHEHLLEIALILYRYAFMCPCWVRSCVIRDAIALLRLSIYFRCVLNSMPLYFPCCLRFHSMCQLALVVARAFRLTCETYSVSSTLSVIVVASFASLSTISLCCMSEWLGTHSTFVLTLISYSFSAYSCASITFC